MRLLWILFAITLGFSTYAQNSISGIVSDHSDGNPLAGVNVFIHELSSGTVTDNSGNFILKDLPSGEFIIHFSFVGFQTIHQKVVLNDTPQQLNIEMHILVIEGDEVVISGNFTSTQHDNTIKISTIGIDQINKTESPSLIASVAEIPGVNMISKGPGVVTPVIRGLSLSNILVMNNGVPLQNYQFSEDHPYLLDENGIARVEVIKGPASLIYGSGAVGGVINLIPEPVAPLGTIKGDYEMRYFSNTVGVLTNLGAKGNQGGFVWDIRGGINSNKDYIQGNNEFAPNTRFNSYNIKAGVGAIRKIGVFKVNYEYNKSNFGMANQPALELVTINERENQFWYQHLTNNLLSSQNKIFLGNVKLDVDLSYQNNNRQLNGDEPGEHFTLVNMTLQTFNYRAKVSHSINEKARYVAGLQGMYQENQNYDAPEQVLPNATINDISFYGLFQYQLSAVKLEAGVRYSYQSIDVPFQEAGSGHSHGEEDEEEDEDEEIEYIQYNGYFNNVSASAGATWNMNDNNLLRLNLASAFRAPNLAELTQHGTHGVRIEEGNPNLTTQQNLEIDLGYHLHTVHTTLDVSVFYNHIYDYIHLAPTADTMEDGDRIYRYSQNDASLYGGEASLHFHPHPLDWLHVVATYSYVVGEYSTGGYLPRIPANDLYFELRFEKNKWKALRNIYFESGIDYFFAQNYPSEFETASPGYFLLNAGIGFALQLKRNQIKFNISGANLLNIDYYSHLSTLQDLGIYNMGRNIMIGIQVPFNLKN